MLRLLESSPSLARTMLQLTARRFRSLTDTFESLSSMGVPERLACAVLKLAKKYGNPTSTGEVTIPIRLSQQDLGSLVGTCRETVNKMLRLWTERQLIRQESGRIVINHLDTFRRFVEEGARSPRDASRPTSAPDREAATLHDTRNFG
jgi:CRP-like cAMP-binding protein